MLLVLLVVFGIFTHPIIDAAEASTTPIRIAVAVGILAPLALFMGMPFSLGMAAAGRNADAPTAFMWGINGAMSVVASVFAVLIAMFFGINTAFATGAVAYLGAGAAMFVIRRAPHGLGAGSAQRRPSRPASPRTRTSRPSPRRRRRRPSRCWSRRAAGEAVGQRRRIRRRLARRRADARRHGHAPEKD